MEGQALLHRRGLILWLSGQRYTCERDAYVQEHKGSTEIHHDGQNCSTKKLEHPEQKFTSRTNLAMIYITICVQWPL